MRGGISCPCLLKSISWDSCRSLAGHAHRTSWLSHTKVAQSQHRAFRARHSVSFWPLASHNILLSQLLLNKIGFPNYGFQFMVVPIYGSQYFMVPSILWFPISGSQFLVPNISWFPIYGFPTDPTREDFIAIEGREGGLTRVWVLSTCIHISNCDYNIIDVKNMMHYIVIK